VGPHSSLTGQNKKSSPDRTSTSHTYIHTYIHTYLHTYIHTYIHTYTHHSLLLSHPMVRGCQPGRQGPRPAHAPHWSPRQPLCRRSCSQCPAAAWGGLELTLMNWLYVRKVCSCQPLSFNLTQDQAKHTLSSSSSSNRGQNPPARFVVPKQQWSRPCPQAVSANCLHEMLKFSPRIENLNFRLKPHKIMNRH